jgi:hypothetical protein
MTDEKPQSVPTPTPSAGLHLLGVLGKDRSGQADSNVARTVRPMPTFIGAQGQWSLANNSGLQVPQAHANFPATSLLVLHPEHRQTGAFCADSRAVRFGGVML